MTRTRQFWVPAVLLALSLGASAKDEGESPKAMKLKNRSAAPASADVDPAVSLASLLQKTGEGDWDAAKAGVVTGAVVQVEKEDDGDYHIALAAPGAEHDTTKWLIVEVTPAWRKKRPNLAPSQLTRLVGQPVTVKGWLYYEPDLGEKDPRGTRWELHPVTSIAVPGAAGGKE